jgi:hypothetical protein
MSCDNDNLKLHKKQKMSKRSEQLMAKNQSNYAGCHAEG